MIIEQHLATITKQSKLTQKILHFISTEHYATSIWNIMLNVLRNVIILYSLILLTSKRLKRNPPHWFRCLNLMMRSTLSNKYIQSKRHKRHWMKFKRLNILFQITINVLKLSKNSDYAEALSCVSYLAGKIQENK